MNKLESEELAKQFIKNIQQSWNSNIPEYIADEIHEKLMAQIEMEFLTKQNGNT